MCLGNLFGLTGVLNYTKVVPAALCKVKWVGRSQEPMKIPRDGFLWVMGAGG